MMSNLNDNVFDDGLNYLANTYELYYLDTDIQLDKTLIAAHTIASVLANSSNTEPDYPGGGRQYKLMQSGNMPITVDKAGTITNFVVCNINDDILVSGHLTNPITVAENDSILMPNFYVIFQDPA